MEQAMSENVGTSAVMLSEKCQVRRTHKYESSDAQLRGGLTSSSCEGSVMELEQRGQTGNGGTGQR